MGRDEQTIWVTCKACGHNSRRHRILYEKCIDYADEFGGSLERQVFHRLAQCMGCESIKYVTSELTMDTYDAIEEKFRVYPDEPGESIRHSGITAESAYTDEGSLLVPAAVWKIYRETHSALNTGIKTLAAGGLRAVVEAICIDKGIGGGSLQAKIDQLAESKYLTQAQADLLHEERYLGNAALHEMATPEVEDLVDGIEIVEGLITTIYMLPHKAGRLKERREAKKKST